MSGVSLPKAVQGDSRERTMSEFSFGHSAGMSFVYGLVANVLMDKCDELELSADSISHMSGERLMGLLSGALDRRIPMRDGVGFGELVEAGYQVTANPDPTWGLAFLVRLNGSCIGSSMSAPDCWRKAAKHFTESKEERERLDAQAADLRKTFNVKGGVSIDEGFSAAPESAPVPLEPAPFVSDVEARNYRLLRSNPDFLFWMNGTSNLQLTEWAANYVAQYPGCLSTHAKFREFLGTRGYEVEVYSMVQKGDDSLVDEYKPTIKGVPITMGFFETVDLAWHFAMNHYFGEKEGV